MKRSYKRVSLITADPVPPTDVTLTMPRDVALKLRVLLGAVAIDHDGTLSGNISYFEYAAAGPVREQRNALGEIFSVLDAEFEREVH
jgi:hypothetical protein